MISHRYTTAVVRLYSFQGPDIAPTIFLTSGRNQNCLIGCCLHFFRNNVSNPECSSFPQITFSNKFINTCSRIRGLLTLHLLESNLGLAVNLSFNEQYEIHAQRMSASPPSILVGAKKSRSPTCRVYLSDFSHDWCCPGKHNGGMKSGQLGSPRITL